jgi:hypothetical protein
MRKYEGRESHPLKVVPPLDCQWQDCINLSSINPLLIFRLQELLGIQGYKNSEDLEILKFNIETPSGMDFCLCEDSKPAKEAYSPLTVRSYKETKFVPHETVSYFAKCKKMGNYLCYLRL